MWKYAPREVYGFQKTHATPTRHFRLEVEVDWGRVFRSLGQRAAFNKSGVSKALNGALVIRARPVT